MTQTLSITPTKDDIQPIILIHSTNIFDERAVTRREIPGGYRRAGDLFPAGWRGIIEVNGIERDVDWLLVPGDLVCALDTPHGAELLVGLALTVVLTGAVVASAVLLPPAVIPSNIPVTKEPEDIISGPEFTGVQTTVGRNVLIPLILGKIRGGGHIVESFFTSEFLGFSYIDHVLNVPILVIREGDAETKGLNTRVAWGWGPLKISSLKIDSNDIDNVALVEARSFSGSKQQGSFLGFEETKVVRTFGTIVTTTPTFNATLSDVDAVEIGFSFPGGLFQVNADGDLISTRVTAKIEIRRTDIDISYEETQIDIDLIKKSRFTTWVRFEFNDTYKRDIRITRVQAQSTQGPTFQDDYTWEFLTEVTAGTSAYPLIANSAFIQVASEQSIVPRNYTALLEGPGGVRIYTSETNYAQHDLTTTRNPAWLFLHWLTHPIYGKGAVYNYEDNVDIPAFLEWAQFCDELVDTGDEEGNLEPRCTFDFEVRRKFTVSEKINLFNLVGHANILAIHGKWTVVIDRQRPTKIIFTEGMYFNSTLKVTPIHTSKNASIMTGKFKDADLDYEDNAIQLTYSDVQPGDLAIEKEVNLWGITRSTHVQRTLNRLLKKEKLVTSRVSFEAGLSGFALEIGDVFGIVSKTIKNNIANGRIIDIDKSGGFYLRLDQSVAFNGGLYQVTIIHQAEHLLDNENLRGITTFFCSPVAQESEFLEISVTQEPISWQGTLQKGDAYHIIEPGGEQIDEYICDEIKHTERGVAITGYKYSPELFTDKCNCEVRDLSELPNFDLIPGPVGNLTITDRPNLSGAIDIGWTPPEVGITNHYEIWYKKASDNRYTFLEIVEGTSYFKNTNLVSGESYTFLVRAVSPTNQKTQFSLATTADHTMP